jgi:hypothetical protein
MRRLVASLHFFQIVPPAPRLMTASTGAIMLAAAAFVIAQPQRAADALAPLLATQVFAVSTGFTASARRGFYDFLLTAGVSRSGAALVQWATAVTPVVIGWFVLAALESARSGHPPTMLASGSVAAMFVVSTLPWALTVTLPRFAGAIGWVLLAVLATTLLPPDVGTVWRDAHSSGWLDAWGFLIFPSRMAGRDAAAYWAIVLPGLAVAALAMVAALLWIHRADIPLEAAQ